MKQRAYRILVARVPGIRERYVEFREHSGRRWAALLYLLWLNIQYYLFFRRSLRESRQFPVYEEKILHCSGSESSLSRRESPEAFAEKLSAALPHTKIHTYGPLAGSSSLSFPPASLPKTQYPPQLAYSLIQPVLPQMAPDMLPTANYTPLIPRTFPRFTLLPSSDSRQP